MLTYGDLIQKEKQEALQTFQEESLRSRLRQRLEEDAKKQHLLFSWFRKPAVAGISVLLLFFLGWLSTHFPLPPAHETEAIAIENTFTRAFTHHGNLITQSAQPTAPEPGDFNIPEFEWSVKRVIFSIQRENTNEKDMAKNLNLVLQYAAVLLLAENNKS
jgi:hypothetical protein